MKMLPLSSVAPLVADRVQPFENVRPYIATGGLDDSGNLMPDMVSHESKPSRADLTVRRGDVCFARMQATSKVFSFTERHTELILSTGFAICRPLPDLLDSRFLYHYLRSDGFQGEKDSLCSGATQKAITNEKITTIEIPLLPLAEQRRIAAVLDKADELRQKRRAALARLDQLTQSIFLDMFGDPALNQKGWSKRELGDLTNLITDGKHGNCRDEDNSGYFFISAKDIHDGVIDYSDARQIPRDEFKDVDNRTNLQPGDLVMVNTGATIGKMAIARDVFETRKTTFQKSVAVIKPKTEYLSTQFLKYVFQYRLRIFADKGSGSAVKNLLLSEMRRIEIILPPIDLQRRFEKVVTTNDRQKVQMQSAFAISNGLFLSLQQRAFRGELFS